MAGAGDIPDFVVDEIIASYYEPESRVRESEDRLGEVLALDIMMYGDTCPAKSDLVRLERRSFTNKYEEPEMEGFEALAKVFSVILSDGIDAVEYNRNGIFTNVGYLVRGACTYTGCMNIVGGLVSERAKAVQEGAYHADEVVAMRVFVKAALDSFITAYSRRGKVKNMDPGHSYMYQKVGAVVAALQILYNVMTRY